jgi:hypothetical protein
MSAPKGKNGFVQGRIVSSQPPRRNIRGENKNDFNKDKIGGFQRGNSSARQTVVIPAKAGIHSHRAVLFGKVATIAR